MPLPTMFHQDTTSRGKHKSAFKIRTTNRFPTIYWLPKGTKIPMQYNSGREVKDFIKFIAEQSTDGLKGYDKNGKKIKKKKGDEL